MATIKTRRRADGITRYTAIVRARKGKKIIYREAKTFSHIAAAKTWARHREVALEDPDALKQAQEEAQPRGADTHKLKSIIRWYIDSFKTVANWGRTKQTTLEFLEGHPVGDQDARELTCQKLVDHVRARRDGGAGPATVANDLVWIGVVLRAAKSAGGMRVRPEVVEEAQTACRELRLTGRPKRRDRRPSEDEKQRLHDYFTRPGRRSGIPMADLVDFAFESSKRLAEICRILWSDDDPVARTGLVRDAKHPTEKEGNHKRFKYTPEVLVR
jgi:integrase